MPQWKITIPEKTDRIVRTYLSQSCTNEDELSKFVDEAVCQKIFQQTVNDLKKHNADRDQQKLMELIDEAVDWARENRS